MCQTVYGDGKKQSAENIIKSIRNLFKLNKEKEATKYRMISDIRMLFEQEDDYYKSIRVGSFWNKNYIEYEGSGDRNKTYQ